MKSTVLQYVTLLLTGTIPLVVSTWLHANESIPRPDESMAAGTYNGSIFLLGGQNYGKQLTEWNSNTKEFVDYGDNYLSVPVYCNSAQYWTQKEEKLYFLSAGTYTTEYYTLNIFNMKTKQLTPNWITVSYPKFDYSGCIASTHDYLYLNGGSDTHNADGSQTLYILQFNSSEWLNDAPSMRTSRSGCASVAYNGYLWTFGGHYTSTNERIVLDNILQNTWEYVDEFSSYAQSPQVIVFRDYLYIITKYDSDSLFLMDANTGTMTLSDDRLPYNITRPAIVLFDGSIHILGGIRSSVLRNTWIYYPLTTRNPTFDPTSDPTFVPSYNPTLYPTAIRDSTITKSTSMNASVTMDNIPSDLQTTLSWRSNSDEKAFDIFVMIFVVIICIVLFAIITLGFLFIKECFLRHGRRDTTADVEQIAHGIQHDCDDIPIGIQQKVESDMVTKVELVNGESDDANVDSEDIVDNKTKGNMAEDEFEVIGDDNTDGHYRTNDGDDMNTNQEGK